MVDLKAQPGEFRMTVQITRAETGDVEEVELVGKVKEEYSNGSNTPSSGSAGSD